MRAMCRFFSAAIAGVALAIAPLSARTPTSAFGDTTQSRSSGPRRVSPYVAPGVVVAPAVDGIAIGGDDGAHLAATLAGPGISILSATTSGSPEQFGRFLQGTEATGFERGIVLSTGLSVDLIGTSDDFSSTDMFGLGDDRASQLAGGPTQDAAVLTLEVVPSRAALEVNFIFASEEYPEFVGSGFNDVAAIFVNGQNCATLPDGSPVAVDSVNDSTNSDFFRGAPEGGLSLDGATVHLTCVAPVRPGSVNQVEIVVADTGDQYYDSALFLGEGSLRSDDPSNIRQGPRPLYGAHGFTGKGSDLDVAISLAKSLIPNLGRTSAPDNGATDGIWSNADRIIENVEDLSRGRLDPRVNVIAHSKGGLDTRAAMWQRPELFAVLGMLSTPNGGSLLADIACGIANAPTSGIPAGLIDLPGFGSCGPGDALFNLTLGYSVYFNTRVRDKSEHSLGVAAGACGGLKCIAINKILCGSSGFLGLGAKPGDTSVCVDSANARTTENGGKHVKLGNFSADHTGMRKLPCPIARTLAFIYGSDNVGNPFIDGDGDGDGCEDLATSSRALAKSSVAADGDTDLDGVMAKTFTLTTEGPETLVDLDVGADELRQVMLFAPAGHPISGDILNGANVIASLEATFEGGAYVGLVPAAAPTPLTLKLSAPVGIVVGVALVVQKTFDLTVEAMPTAPGSVAVTVNGGGLAPGTTLAGVVSNVTGRPALTQDVPFSTAATAAGTASLTVTMSAPIGQPAMYVVRLTAPVQRYAQTSALGLPEGGAIGGVVSEELVDRDSDGVDDALRMGFDFTALRSSVHELGLDVTDAVGSRITSLSGRAINAGGSSVVTIDLPLGLLFTHAGAGPYQLRNGILVDVDQDRIVAMKDPVGSTALTGVGGLTPPRTLLGPAEARLDKSSGRTAVVFDSAAVTLDTRQYVVDGLIVAPTGAVIHVSQVVGGSPGRHAVSFVVSATEVSARGRGTYTLQNLEIHEIDDVFVLDDAPGASIDVVAETLILDRAIAWPRRSKAARLVTNGSLAAGLVDFSSDFSVMISDGFAMSESATFNGGSCRVHSNGAVVCRDANSHSTLRLRPNPSRAGDLEFRCFMRDRQFVKPLAGPITMTIRAGIDVEGAIETCVAQESRLVCRASAGR